MITYNDKLFEFETSFDFNLVGLGGYDRTGFGFDDSKNFSRCRIINNNMFSALCSICLDKIAYIFLINLHLPIVQDSNASGQIAGFI